MPSPEWADELLRTLLPRAGSARFTVRTTLQQALRHPWCWPQEAELEGHALAVAGAKPAMPLPGEALLVSASDTSSRAALWRLKRRLLHEPLGLNDFDFRRNAKQTLRGAEQIVTRGLPFILSLEPLLRQEEWCAELITKAGSGQYDSLDGASYGLSMLLAVASLLMDVPLPEDLAASATIDEAGGLGPVDALEGKIRLLVGSGLGLKRLVVEQSQVAEAQQFVAQYGGRLAVHGARAASEVFQSIFGEAYEVLSLRLDSPEKVRKAVRNLFLLALEARSPILDWRAVERGAETVLANLSPDEPSRREAYIARQVARRHDHKPAPLEWPSEEMLQELNRPIRDKLLAHTLQAFNDAGDARLGQMLEQEMVRVPRAEECYEPQLVIRGAIGRALASLRRYTDARDYLRDTVEAWRAIGQFEEASHAICELIRVVGVLGSFRELDDLSPLVEQFRSHPRVDAASRGFLYLALARACVQVGQSHKALTFLCSSEVSWNAARDHLQWCRLRWQAKALANTGHAHEATAARKRLHGETGTTESLMARLDEVLELDADPHPLLDRLLAEEGLPMARLLTGLESPREKAERVVREYPY